jgi:hypothetical protein
MTPRSAILPTSAAALFAVASVCDIAFLAVLGSHSAPPLAVSILFAAFGVITLAALVPASRGSRRALITAVVVRCVSALMAFIAFFAGAPVWVMIGEAIVIVATIAALALLRRRPAATVTA